MAVSTQFCIHIVVSKDTSITIHWSIIFDVRWREVVPRYVFYYTNGVYWICMIEAGSEKPCDESTEEGMCGGRGMDDRN